jgi:hypothetical protein
MDGARPHAQGYAPCTTGTRGNTMGMMQYPSYKAAYTDTTYNQGEEPVLVSRPTDAAALVTFMRDLDNTGVQGDTRAELLTAVGSGAHAGVRVYILMDTWLFTIGYIIHMQDGTARGVSV